MHLSKSQYMRGLQCHKKLWLYKNKPELALTRDQTTLNRIETGFEVGELAKSLFPGGTEVVFDRSNFDGMIEQTARLISAGESVIYEAAFRTRGVFIKVDILVRNGDAWDIYEVKASTKVKSFHKNDLAIQWFVIQDQLSQGTASLIHIDTKYVYSEELDPFQLLKIVDVTDTVKSLQEGIADKLSTMEEMLAKGEPDIKIGTQCINPDCEFKSYCWGNVPSPSVLDLYRLNGDRKFELFHSGQVYYEDLENLELTPTQLLQIETTRTGKIHVDKNPLGEFLKQATYPINFLDFESFQNAIPWLPGQKPFMQIPFQFSLHILHEDGELEHREFIGDGLVDPRLALTEHLISNLTGTGSIVAYNQSFEKSVIRGLAREFKQHEERLTLTLDRFIDLITPFRELMVYLPGFNGSFSIKSILPAMLPDRDDMDYKKLEIPDGEVAMDAYAHLIKVISKEKRDAVRHSLLDYCKLDTLAMVEIWKVLRTLVEK
jgi:hypothetical protein